MCNFTRKQNMSTEGPNTYLLFKGRQVPADPFFDHLTLLIAT